uniref:MADF domain-containing protein n=1 Tax=Acrobeloides nanus TaxID=290746 RepID=A0A914CGD3_9BILA
MFSINMPPKKNEKKAKFIEAVRELPFLYDKKDTDYKNKTKADKKWAELATDFNYKDSNEAKSTWKNVVTAYGNNKRAASSATKKTYVFAEELSFLDGIKEGDNRTDSVASSLLVDRLRLPQRSSTSNSIDFSQYDEHFGFPDEDQLHEVEKPKAKHAKKSTAKDESAKIDLKLLEAIGSIGESLSKNESAGEAFGRTVAIALNEMPLKKRLEAQLKIQQILLDYTD